MSTVVFPGSGITSLVKEVHYHNTVVTFPPVTILETSK